MTLNVLMACAALVPEAPSQVDCRPPSGFTDGPPPALAPPSRLVSHTEEIVVDRPLDQVTRAAQTLDLEDAIDGASSLPHVRGTRNLTPGAFGAPGTRRLVCLSDGSTLVEQVLANESGGGTARFRYVVWNYSSEKARPVSHAVGEFVRTDLGDGRTRVVWTYSFALRRNRLPGALGALGRWLFRVSFLDTTYAGMMRGTLAREKAHAEREPAAGVIGSPRPGARAGAPVR